MASDEVQKTVEKANMQLASGDYKKSYNTLKKLVKNNPDVAEAHFIMAEAAMGIPKITVREIAKHYQDACDNDPKNPLYYATYGNFCFENGILKKGEECFLKASDVDEDNSSIYLSDLATGYFTSAKNFKGRYPNLDDDEIARTSLKYILQAFDIPPEKAINLIGDIKDE